MGGNVINLQCHGDNYKGNVKGLQKSTPSDNECGEFVEAGTTRVGAVVSTIGMYGPGLYEVWSKAPPTDAETGRGYCLAMWTFGYSEHYDPLDAQFVRNATWDPEYKGLNFDQEVKVYGAYCENECIDDSSCEKKGLENGFLLGLTTPEGKIKSEIIDDNKKKIKDESPWNPWNPANEKKEYRQWKCSDFEDEDKGRIPYKNGS